MNSDSVRIVEECLLSDDWYVLKKTVFDYRRRDGNWQRLSRETYDRGNGAVLLLFNVDQDTVVLTRQFRFPTYVNGCGDGLLIEACAGLLDCRCSRLLAGWTFLTATSHKRVGAPGYRSLVAT